MSIYAEVDGVMLQKFKFVASQYISTELAQHFGEAPEVEVILSERFMFDELCLRIVQEIWGREVDASQEISYPADWWQAFKERWFPKWALVKWPVRYETKKMTVMEFYPKLSLPGQEAVVHIWKRDLSEEP